MSATATLRASHVLRKMSYIVPKKLLPATAALLFVAGNLGGICPENPFSKEICIKLRTHFFANQDIPETSAVFAIQYTVLWL